MKKSVMIVIGVLILILILIGGYLLYNEFQKDHQVGELEDFSGEESSPVENVGPGGCTSEEECKAYCDEHIEECQEFKTSSEIGGEATQPKYKEDIIIPDKLKGFWIIDTRKRDTSTFKDVGANTVLFEIKVEVNPDGDAQLLQRESDIIDTIRFYQNEGFLVGFSLAVDYKEDFSMPENEIPQPIPTNVPLNKFNEVVIAMAELAEEESVAIFSPLNEPDNNLNNPSWNKEILPLVKKKYTGLVLFKGGPLKNQASIGFDGYDVLSKADLTGYDMVGMTLMTTLDRGEINDYKNNLLAVAEKNNIDKIIISELGIWSMGWTEAEKTEIHKAQLEETSELDGWLVFDPPTSVMSGLSEETLDVIKTHFS